MAHAVSLLASLIGLWLLLSGHYVPLIMGLGAASCLLVVFIALRMDVADHEGHPIHLSWRAVIYWPWLTWEIVKSNIQVARIVIDPRLPIDPRVIKVKAGQGDDVGLVTYANSITLTPGTVSIDVRGGTIEVHALTAEFAAGVESGEMDRRVTALTGGS